MLPSMCINLGCDLFKGPIFRCVINDHNDILFRIDLVLQRMQAIQHKVRGAVVDDDYAKSHA